MVFHWSLSDSKSPQVYTTLLSILAVRNIAVVWMVSTLPPTSKCSIITFAIIIIIIIIIIIAATLFSPRASLEHQFGTCLSPLDLCDNKSLLVSGTLPFLHEFWWVQVL